MNKYEKALLWFLRRFPDSWHTFALDKTTLSAVQNLEENGWIEVNEYQQMKLGQRDDYQDHQKYLAELSKCPKHHLHPVEGDLGTIPL